MLSPTRSRNWIDARSRNVAGGAGADTVNVAALTATGTYTNLGALDTIEATNGANITGVNAGAATGAGASSFLPQAASEMTIREAISSDLDMMDP
jgi:hypothetical protein